MTSLPPPTGNVIALFVDPLDRLGEENYSALALSTWHCATATTELMRKEPLDLGCTYLGPGIVCSATTFVHVDGRHWFLIPKSPWLKVVREEPFRNLGMGAQLDLGSARLAYLMPSEWDPEPFMKKTCAGSRIFWGPLPEGEWFLALPVIPEGCMKTGGYPWAAFLTTPIRRPVASLT